MASQLDIVNEALGLLGEMPIDDLDDVQDPKAVRAKVFWQPSVEQLLQRHEWSFATRRAELAQDAEEPVFGYDYAYTLPSDHIRTMVATPHEGELDVDTRSQTDYRVEYGHILTNEAAIYLKYICRIAEPGRFSPLFASALSAALAVKLGPALNKSAATVQAMVSLSEMWLKEAKAADVREGKATVYKRSSWKDAR